MAELVYRPPDLGRWLLWTAYALALAAAPLIFDKGASLSILSQIGTLTIACLSYNMLLGHGGMLSFGHAVYSGLGAFVAIHAMNLAAQGAVWLPVTLVPLVGGIAGMVFGMLFGFVTTRKSGTTFAMITLGIVELVSACSLMFPGFFGGEGGITTNRVMGKPVFGISYGPQIQVCYLIAFWLFVSTAAMFAFTRTPLGRILNAVRDNPERAEFIGYDTHKVRYLALIISAFFAGIAGGLGAINFEIVTAENVSAIRSASYLLCTFIGGIGFFWGPIVGAIVGVFLTVMLSDFTKAWQLYVGLIFIALVMHAPGGLASIIAMHLRIATHRLYGRIWPALWPVLAASTLVLAGAVAAIEMLYHLSLESSNGSLMRLFGLEVDTARGSAWLAAAVLMAVGASWFRRAMPAFRSAWDEVNADIEGGKARRT
jgi:branched-chain amino acid transport system permease protein